MAKEEVIAGVHARRIQAEMQTVLCGARLLTNPPVMINIINMRPIVVLQAISPYPTVDDVTSTKYAHSQYPNDCTLDISRHASPEFSH